MLKAQIIGNIGGEPNMQYSANGQGFLRFNIASNYRTRSQSGEWEDKTEWVRVTVFGKRAESLSSLLKKGMRVFADGRLEARAWKDDNGNARPGLELLANDVEFFSTRNEDGQQPARTGQRQSADDDLSDVPF